MKGFRLAGTAALLLFGALGAAHGQSITYMVDCTEGQNVSDAISRGDAKKPLVIVVRGTCEESITIARDDVTIRGDTATAGRLHGPAPGVDTVVVSGDRVALRQLTVTGGNVGVRIQGGYNLILDQVTVRDTGGRGVLVRSGTLEFTNSTIEHAGHDGLYLTRGAAARLATVQVLENSGRGIFVDSNAMVMVASSTIRSNASSGVQLEAGAHGVFNNTTVDWNGTNPSQPGMGILATGAHVVVNAGNVIAHNREDGIQAVASSTLVLSQSTVSDNGGSGVFGYLGANVVLHGPSTIAGNNSYGVQCRAHCTTQMDGATIQNNSMDGIAITLGSVLIVGEGNHSSDNGGWGLWCGDGESSVDGLEKLSGTVFKACTGFGATKVVAGLIYKTGAPSVVTPHGFTSAKVDIGTYEIHFPAGTFATFPMVTVTPARGITGPDTPFAIARIEQIIYSPESGSAVATVRLSSTSPVLTPIDQGFYFIATESVPAP